MKLNIGDFVRTTDGEIGKIIECPEVLKENYGNWLWFETIDEQRPIIKEHIIKSSPNIIDLIEEDDLIKIEYELASGEKQSEVIEVIKSNSGEHKLFVNAWVRKCFIEDFKRYDIKIKSIVTKEQFEAMKYKIESEE